MGNTAGGDGLKAARFLSIGGDDGPPAVQGSRLHFTSALESESSSGGPVYGPGSFENPEALRAFLLKSDVDVSAWNEGEAKGVTTP